MDWSIAGTAVAAAIAVLVKVYRWARARFQRIADFLDDWSGEPPRPGYEGRPSVPERLTRLEVAVAELTTRGPPRVPPRQKR